MNGFVIWLSKLTTFCFPISADMKNLFKFILFVLILSLALAGAYRIFEKRGPDILPLSARASDSYTPVQNTKLDLSKLDLLTQLDSEFVQLAKAVTPSVVSINTSRTLRAQMIDPFEMLWGNRRPREFQQQQTSLGSGAIVSLEGHIITNNHVIDGMEEISVLLSDGRRFDAELIGTDPDTDVAVLKIEADNLQALPFGDSDAVQVGQMVFAVGNPFGLEESVTQGIISAIGRRTMSDSGNEFLQTDTAINPGNSGGPLVNLKGEIVGVNNHIFSKSGGYQGIAFAIPSNVARRTLESVVQTGRVVRGYLGIIMQPLTSELANHFGLPDENGTLVAEVVQGSPADKAGLQAGDIIRKFDGRNIKDMMELRTRVGQTQVNEEVEVEVFRHGREEILKVTILEMPSTSQIAQQRRLPGGVRPNKPPASDVPAAGPLEGVAVRDVTPAIIQQFNLPPNIEGVQVVEVEQGSPAAQVLQPGDVIEEIDRRPVRSEAEYLEVVQNLKRDQRIMLFICRERTRSFVMIVPQ